MASMDFLITNEVGLHARPGALFVQTAQRFKSDIQILKGAKKGNAKSILGVLGLGITKDTTITVEANGEDAEEALKALKALVDNNFGE